MKTGIIIIFHNDEEQIDIQFYITQILKTTNIEFCLVNNDSRDETLYSLNEIKEACNNVSVIDIRKFKSDVSAAKAGARFMYSAFNLKNLGYVSTNMLNTKYHGLNGLIKVISENQDLINNYKSKSTRKKKTLFQSLFSLIDYLKKIKLNNPFVELQFQRNL